MWLKVLEYKVGKLVEKVKENMWSTRMPSLLDHILSHGSHQGRCDAPFGCKVHGVLSLTANFTPVWDAALYQPILWKQVAWTSGSNFAVVGHISIKECTFLSKSSGHVFSWHAFLKVSLKGLPLKHLPLCGCLTEVWYFYCKGAISVLFCTWILYWGGLFLV